nr:hypothetical protein [Pseudomonas sp. BIGb0427]
MLYLDTPLSKAIVSLFERAFTHAARQTARSVEDLCIWWLALHILTNARGSADVDAELMAAEHLLIAEVKAVYQAPEDFEVDGEDFSVVFDQAFNNALCPLHQDFEERAIALPGQELSPLQVFIAHPIDLAISSWAALPTATMRIFPH